MISLVIFAISNFGEDAYWTLLLPILIAAYVIARLVWPILTAPRILLWEHSYKTLAFILSLANAITAFANLVLDLNFALTSIAVITASLTVFCWFTFSSNEVEV